MFKATNGKENSFKDSSLILVLPGEGNTTQFTLSLFTSNFDFSYVGYFYSKFLNHTVSINSKDNSPMFNGAVLYNENKNIIIIDLSGGIKKAEKFENEIFDFISKNKIKQTFLLSSTSKENISDVDILSKLIRVYSLSHNVAIKKEANCYPYQDAYRLDESKREGKIYKEMSLLDGDSETRELVQFLLIDKVDFALLFSFADSIIDPYVGMALYNKLSFILGMKETNEEVERKEKDKAEVIDEMKTKCKVDEMWKDFLNE